MRKRPRTRKSLVDTTFVNPTVPIVTKNGAYEENKPLRRRLQKEEQEARDKADPLKQAERQFSRVLQHARQQASEYWRQLLDEIRKTWSTSEAATDMTFSVELTRDSFSSEDAENAFNAFFYERLPKTPYAFRLSEDGQKCDGAARLVLYGMAQAKAGRDMSNVAAWESAFEHMREVLKAFAAEEVIVDESKLPKPVERKPSLDEILEAEDGESASGRRRMIAAVENDFLDNNFRNCWLGFTNSLYERFGYVLTEKEKKTFIEAMFRLNMNLNRPADYDKIRVALVKSGELGKGYPHLCYPSEILEAEIENADLNDYEVRRSIAQRTRQLSE